MNRVVIGLGANLGEREAQLARALEALEEGVLKRAVRSHVHETPALMPDGAPKAWNIPFLNMAVAGDTALAPRALLRALKDIESALGRQEGPRWAPRVIDLDILCYGDLSLEETDLRIPHPGLLTRAFALLPLAEVWPEWRYPGREETARDLAARLA